MGPDWITRWFAVVMALVTWGVGRGLALTSGELSECPGQDTGRSSRSG